jgi:hypothetical protein
MPPFIIGSTIYPSKKVAVDSIRKLVNSFKDQVVLKQHKAWNTLIGLVELHTNSLYIKTSAGVKGFHIHRCDTNKRVNVITVINNLNTKRTFAWASVLKEKKVKASDNILSPSCSLKSKDRDVSRKLNACLRQSIVYQIQQFRDENKFQNTCENCLKKCNSTKMHVDHMIEFAMIKKEFRELIWNDVEPTQFKYDKKLQHRYTFLLGDRGFEIAWQEYHLQRTKNKLQFVCPQCNLSTLKKKDAVRKVKVVQKKIV